MKKIALYALLLVVVYSCGSNDRGELVGVQSKRKWFAEKPAGMALIPSGSFTMGKQDEDDLGSMNTPTRTVTVSSFYMDETEITNSEYKEFVQWVKDSVVRRRLADQADLVADATAPAGNALGIQVFAYKIDTVNATAYDKYMAENYYDLEEGLQPLDWEPDLIWETGAFPDADYVEVMDSLYIRKEESVNGMRTFNTKVLKYSFPQVDVAEAVRKGKQRIDSLDILALPIYPDTTVWVKDFNYSYNDPMHQEYFSHQAYSDYPVIGVSWDQARAFCHWRTKKRNSYLSGKKNAALVPAFRLPTEAEWEFAARGGLNFGKYPWGGPSTTSDRGCFLANFKPVRGDYAVDGALYTLEAESFNANDYGLYNMAGNVSEWTATAYNQLSYYMGSTMNPNVENKENKRKIVRGGSWKDVAYFLEVSSRDYEYADTARSYIGFRTVQDYLGTKKN